MATSGAKASSRPTGLSGASATPPIRIATKHGDRR